LNAPHHLLEFTASIGVAMIDQDEDIHDAIRRADRALYRAKEQGRNRVICAEMAPLPEYPIAVPA